MAGKGHGEVMKSIGRGFKESVPYGRTTGERLGGSMASDRNGGKSGRELGGSMNDLSHSIKGASANQKGD